MSIDAKQLHEYVVRPALVYIGLHSPSAAQLVMGTIAQESACGRYLRQLGPGPARGIAQMEPATHGDHWRWLRRSAKRASLAEALESIAGSNTGANPPADALMGNLFYAAAMCRVHYYRRPEPLPEAGDWRGHAEYWKRWYNTEAGAGTVEQFARAVGTHKLRAIDW